MMEKKNRKSFIWAFKTISWISAIFFLVLLLLVWALNYIKIA